MCVEDKYAQTIAIVYPAIVPYLYNIPTDKTIRTHVTISILGEIADIDFNKEELIASLRNIEWHDVSDVKVDKLALFGIRNDFLVMLINAPSLQRNWQLVNEILTSAGIESMDKYPTYRPHITLMENYEGSLPTPEFLPHTLKVGFPALWWGTEMIDLR